MYNDDYEEDHVTIQNDGNALIDQSVGGEHSGEHSNPDPDDRTNLRQTPRTDPVLAEIRKINVSMRAIADRVEVLERRDVPTPKRHRAPEMQSWASRMELDESAEADDFSDEEDTARDRSSRTVALSENNAALVTSSFGNTISNVERRKIRSAFPIPEVEATRCPRLDPVFKAKSKAETKTADAELARIQAFVHDPVGPLVQLLQGLGSDDEAEPQLSPSEARTAVKDAVKLLGNASAQISRLRRKKVIKAVNPDLVDLAERNTFQDAAPSLFGDDFEDKLKKRAKSLKLFDNAEKPPPKKFFRGGRPTVPQRGGGRPSYSNRGGRQAWSKKDKSSHKK